MPFKNHVSTFRIGVLTHEKMCVEFQTIKPMEKLNPKTVEFLSANAPASRGDGRQAIELDPDVLAALNAIYKAMDGRKPKRRIVNDILRAAFMSDTFNDVFAAEAA